MSGTDAEITYAYTEAFNKNQWAWEFLRRNPAYIKDYQWFINQWRALETDYGRSPEMDYQAWKQDPRSYKIIDIADEQDGNCAISEDKLLIECWMGNKWGFYQFPQSPTLTAGEIDITWRALPPDYEVPANPAETDKTDYLQQIEFDLTKSLKAQLEQARHLLIISQRRLKKQGRLIPYTIAGKAGLWRNCLYYLDKTQSGSDPGEHYEQQIIEEAAYNLKHYLNILTLTEK